MAFWNRNHHHPGDLIGDDNSDEPRLTTTQLDELHRPGQAIALEAWEPLLRNRARR